MLSSRVRSTRPSSRRVLNALFLAIALLVPTLTNGIIGATAASPPTLATDKLDYLPGETVHIIGSGYNAGASYAVPVRRPDSSIIKGDGSFTPGWDVVVADAGGNIVYDYQLDGIAGLYEARTYAHPFSGNWALAPLSSVKFTDALTVNLDQCANLTTPCTWQNGNLNQNNSAYAEGEVVPFRLAIEDLGPGTHTIHINYDFTSGGHEAYDFLATYNATETVDLCAPGGGGLSSLCAGGLPPAQTINFESDPFAVPDANNLTVAGAEAAAALPRQLTYFGATVQDVTVPVHEGPTDGNSTADIVITFTTTGASSAVLFAWGGHLAASSYWIEGTAPDGAGQISGAPWHMRTQQLDGSGNKNQDRSIQPSAIIPPPAMGSITIIKDTVPDDPQDFAYTSTIPGFENFTLDDDGDENIPGPFRSLTVDVAPGEYRVQENLPVDEFDLTALVCVDPSGDTTTDLATGLASINLAASETVVCTYTNTKQAPMGTLIIEKDTIPNGSTPFSFTPVGFNSGDAFVLDDDGTALPNPNSRSFPVPGDVPLTVTESTVTGFVLSSIVCTNAAGPIPAERITINVPSVTVTVLDDEVVTCVFTNRQQGRIVIRKNTVPNDPQDFLFIAAGSGLSNFLLEDDGNEMVAPFNSQTFHVLPGDYRVQEQLPVPGFELTSLVCTDPTNNTTTTLATGLAAITLDAGEIVECVFTNTKPTPPDVYGTDPKTLPTERPYDPVPAPVTSGQPAVEGDTGGQPAGDTGSAGGTQDQPTTTDAAPGAEVAGTTEFVTPGPESSSGPSDESANPVVDSVVEAVWSQIDLPRTGAELIQQALLGLILVGGGLLLLALRRRRSSSTPA
ncbi:MAG TPA: LPXTG cell wall anchor domain-containing protein [Acidimicrobiia bacterium]|nr:LPXTG cell wall anchor domain-containing protein [Acidimicrobiia bacterium]